MWYFIRWTSDDTNKQQIADLFENYIVSREYSRRQKLHYHIVANSSLDKEQLKEYMYSNLTHKTRGVCTLKIDIVGPTEEDLDKCSTYSVKDDDYIYSSFFEDRIENYVANSYSKDLTPTVRIQEAIRYQLEEKDTPNYTQLWREIAFIKADAGHEIYPNKISALILSVQLRANPDCVEDLIQKYFIEY